MTQLFSEMQERRVRQRIKMVTRYLPQGHLLEVGPGSGEVLRRLAALGYHVTGVEHSPTMAQLIRDRYGLDVKVGAFEDHDLTGAAYDAYLSFHVIEHVPDVPAHLRKAAELVRPGGLAFIATPNADSWEHRLAQSLSPNYSPVHLQLFSRASMTRLLQQAGWDVIDVLTPCYTDSWLRVASSLWRRLRGRQGGGGELVKRSDTPARRLAIRLLGIADAPLRGCQQVLRGGNELVVIARRREAI
jgi:SAM-dependent methyltransferase